MQLALKDIGKVPPAEKRKAYGQEANRVKEALTRPTKPPWPTRKKQGA